jgi:acyl-coenzyme A synthetase/AMP-(fatty) acid ligase
MLLRTRRLKEKNFSSLRHLICAGEVLPPDVLRAWMKMYPHVQFTNMYGPTEITVDCSFHVITSPPEDDELAVPIGRARPNMELFVRNESGSLSKEVGACGELLVRGTSVAYGYLGDEEKTRKAFIQNPNNHFFHDPLYCTGDLVEINGSREFMFLGRTDDQIKYLGYRIELGEIEAALKSIEGIDEGVVVFNNATDSSQQAIGALVGAHELSIGQITADLRKRLPGYMVPATIQLTSTDFPRTANGKYDRRAIRSLLFVDHK